MTEDELPLWKYDGSSKVKYMNLYDVVQLFINYSQSLLINIQKGLGFQDELNFLITNGMGNVFDKINIALIQLVDCEINRIYAIRDDILILIFTGVGTLSFCVVILGYFIYVISKDYNVL